ncbi:uncharacterized protein LOC134848727 [Symsagittifera roscoffensis]|uniref:uncharacterized protein LOC134848727 n=1 Tax=Symsagittifera roscoffensis TaxID=84072 RepID=UPI00307C50C3
MLRLPFLTVLILVSIEMVLSSEAYYNTSFCCDDDSNLVFRNFTTTEFSYNWPGYEETSRWMHGAVESIGDLIFTSEVPQERLANLYIQNRENETSVTIEDIREEFHEYGFKNLGYTLVIVLGSLCCLMVVMAIVIVAILWRLKKAFVTLKDGRCGFYSLSVLIVAYSILVMPAVYLMRQNWNELEDSYPDTFMSRVGNINENLQGYITSSTEDVDSLRYEQLSFTFEQIQNNLDDLPSLTFHPVERKILDDITGPMNSFNQALEAADSAWASMLVSYDLMMNGTSAVSGAVFEAKGHLNDMQCTTSDTECQLAGLLGGDVGRHENYFTSEMANPLEAESFQVFEVDIGNAVNQEMDTMVETINASVSSAVQEMTEMASNAENTTDSLLGEISEDLFETLSTFDLRHHLWQQWDRMKADGHDFIQSMKPFYLSARLIGVIMSVIGLLLPIGAVIVWRKKPPEDRNLLNHILGFVMLGFSLLSALCSIVLMVLAVVMFWETSPALKFCSSMAEGNMDFIDHPFVVDNSSERYFAHQILSNESIPLTFLSILDDCYQNEPIYVALQLSSSAKYDIEGTLNVGELLPGAANVFSSATPDISATVLVPDALKTTMTSFDNSEFDGELETMNLTSSEILTWHTQLMFGTPGVTVACDPSCKSMTDIRDELQGYLNAGIEPNTARSNAQSALTVLNHLLDTLIPDMQQLASHFQANKSHLQDSLSELKRVIDEVFLPAENTLQNWIANDATPMLETSVEAVGSNVEKYLGNYLDWVMAILEGELGMCGPVATAYDYFWNFTCDKIVQPANVIWFLAIWVSLCLFSTSICAFRISFYLFRPRQVSEKKPVESETVITTAEEKVYESQPTTASKSRRSSVRDMLDGNLSKSNRVSPTSFSMDTDAGTGSTHDTWIHNENHHHTTLARHPPPKRGRKPPRIRDTCAVNTDARRVSEVPIVPTLLLAEKSVSPTPSEDVVAGKPPISGRSRGAMSHIMKIKRVKGEGRCRSRNDRPRSAPGNFIWNKVVFVGSRGSTNLFATTSSSREDSLADGLSDYAESDISTPKMAWSFSQTMTKKITEETNLNEDAADKPNKTEETKTEVSKNKQEKEEESFPLEDRVTPLIFGNHSDLKLEKENSKADEKPEEAGSLKSDDSNQNEKEDKNEKPSNSESKNRPRTSRESNRQSSLGLDDDSSTEADRVYFTRTPNGLKSTKPVVLASVTPRNNATSRDPASDSTTNSENPDKSQKSKIKNNREKEPENTVSMGQEPSSQIGNEAGDLRSKKNESPATDAKIEMQSARGNKRKPSDDLNEERTKGKSSIDSIISPTSQPDENSPTDTSESPTDLSPLPFPTTGSVRRESTLIMPEEPRVPSGGTHNTVIVYRHAENKKNKKKKNNNNNKLPPIGKNVPPTPPGGINLSDYKNVGDNGDEDVRSKSGGSYRSVDDTRPGFIDASLLKDKSKKK